MKIGFEINDRGFNKINLMTPEEGNPGVGGTQFEFVLVINSILKFYDNYEVFIYHYSENYYPITAHDIIVSSEEDMLEHAERNDIDVLVYKTDKNEFWYNIIKNYSTKLIAWAHTYLKYEELKFIEHSSNVVRLICVGKEQYDTHIDDEVINKTEYIYNMVDTSDAEIRGSQYGNEVTYIGSLIREKGFHVLAKAWKDVLREIPDAKLNVIGSGKLYNRNSKLGEYNIAEDIYEDSFIKYLLDKDGNILSSVIFWGILGAEKKDVIKNTAVGIVNPTAISETFCISAVEFEGQGIPVCSCRKNGLLDTVQHRSTGLLSKSSKTLSKDIIKLLRNKKTNLEYGQNAIEYVKKFQPEAVVKDWDACFKSIMCGEKARYYKVNGNYFNNAKFIRIFSRGIRFTLRIKCFPSINTVLYNCRKIYHKVKGVC